MQKSVYISHAIGIMAKDKNGEREIGKQNSNLQSSPHMVVPFAVCTSSVIYLWAWYYRMSRLK